MDNLQKQVSILSNKVDALYQLVEQLSGRVSEVVSECRFGTEQIHRLETGTSPGSRAQYGYSTVDSSMEHKDVLMDSNNLDATHQNGEKQLSPEIQIQRLTAQLTAAYNRIAALEEQLLSQRIH
ncbi:hypothetical protein [Leptothermofonsia sp. ETS-13]|uniref:hypothetical protein n=1 Tax=Leptothermofonsia sp. ETS-13 TaxID=3035696 RepID=UPI003BA311AD